MFSLLEEIRLNHASAVKANPTVARYFALDFGGIVIATDFAWGYPADRNGDGEAEADAFIEASRENGFAVADVTGEFPVGPGLPGNIGPGDSLRVYRADDGAGDVQFFALAVVAADGYWDRETEQWITVGA